ncbi:pyridoxamine 5'-phosphate oxidase family protein, partial [Streptomyces sp. SM14]|uniref:pyridoxamine 5'-phosphate oxidase family protein n=1 Tax=Streptomyces sp. SM14 TaxID=1736045 RepID=UPI000CD563A6
MSSNAPGEPAFDVDQFLARPLTARIATDGPTVRPVWFLWEDGAFWVLTGPWTRLYQRVRENPRLALVVDDCDVRTGEVRQVIARGDAELLPFDIPRGRRKLTRYLGPDESGWDQRFRLYLHEGRGGEPASWLRLAPARMRVADLSYRVASTEPGAESGAESGTEPVPGNRDG